MPGPTPRFSKARQRSRRGFVFPLLALGVLVASCKPTGKSSPASVGELVSQLAGARIDAARTKLELKRPDEALALLVSALKAEPASEEARDLAGTILKQTVWNFPALTLPHPLPIEQVNFAGPSALWVSLGGKTNTTVRWNLETPQVESVLFPVADHQTRSLVFDAAHQSVVVERGPVTLLCNARTLKPIRNLGPLPDFLTPSSVIVFSPDGLLMAHPGFLSKDDHSIIWHLRDTSTGEIIRSSEPIAPRPLAAFLDRARLRVLHSDGSLLEMPVSPVEPVLKTPMPEPVKLLHAQFSQDGNAALTLQDPGPHQPPVPAVIAYRDEEDGSLGTAALARRFPWSSHPNLWTGLMSGPEHAPFAVDGNRVTILTNPQAPIELASAVTAVAFDEKNVLTGEENGTLTIHRLLPLPGTNSTQQRAAHFDKESLLALEDLSDALAGSRYEEKERRFTRIASEPRIAAFNACDFTALLAVFPGLDFAAILAEFKSIAHRHAAPEAFAALRDRLDRADPPAAAALALALKSDDAEAIKACLANAVDLPPLLRRISLSRIAWLQGRKADALSGWSEVFPDLAEVRLREDWLGWERTDFQPALDQLRECVSSELAAIQVPENSTPEQRKAIIARFTDPATIAAVGRARFADACLKAALAFSAHKDEKAATFQLASLARNLGAPAEPCLRAEALALTALGDYQNAHPRWIELITEHPVETTLPGDYAEAAYTAFENADPRQAMEILTTGMHRFPRDGNFALRAGWVALLTGNSERAYRFLREGQRIGFPAEKLENATALLVIAAAQTGANDDAAVYFQDLLKIDPAWADPATLDTLEWPEELKTVLGQFMQ
jgi:tetratricopeptide (TPR) repeat protein